MVPDTVTEPAVRRGEPLPELSDTPVYTRDGYRLGRAVDIVVNVTAERATALLVAVDEAAFPHLRVGRKGVTIPYHRVEGFGDVVVVDVPGAAFRSAEATDYESAELSEALANGAKKRRVR